MELSFQLSNQHNIYTIDIGYPKLGHLGWCFINTHNNKEYTGSDLVELFP